MTLSITRRFAVTLGAGAASCAFTGPVRADALATPTERKLLTITGKIMNRNDGEAAVFDRPMLEAIGLDVIEGTSPW